MCSQKRCLCTHASATFAFLQALAPGGHAKMSEVLKSMDWDFTMTPREEVKAIEDQQWPEDAEDIAFNHVLNAMCVGNVDSSV